MTVAWHAAVDNKKNNSDGDEKDFKWESNEITIFFEFKLKRNE